MSSHIFDKVNAGIVRRLLACCMIAVATSVSAAEVPAFQFQGAAAVTGEALEVRYAGSYTYLRLRTQDGETWAAVLLTPVSQGDTVTIDNAIVMHNFESKPLNKTFKTILFGTLNGIGADATVARVGAARAMRINLKISGDIQVNRASGKNALTVL